MKMRPCYPKCFVWPTVPSIFCDMPNVPICCIQWTLPEGTVTHDSGYIASRLYPAGGIPQASDYCFTSQLGAAGFSFIDDTVVTEYYGDVRACASLEGGVESSCPVVTATTPEVIYDFPEYLDYEFYNSTATVLFVAPILRWWCEGSDSDTKVVFQAGWLLFYASGPGTCSCIEVPIAQGDAGPDWYTGGSPPSFYLAPLADGYPGVTVQPLVCNYLPCGDPLDCFAACISGTEDCDGVTPAHKPVIYFTYIGVGCCLSGTYPLTYGTGPLGGLGYHMATKSCVNFGVTFTMDVALKCGALSGTGDVDRPAGSNSAYLFIQVTDSEGNHYLYATLVSLSCSGGSLVEATGEIGDSQCGLSIDGTADWALSG